MTREALLAELMRLPVEERHALARDLLGDSDTELPMDPDVEASILAELARRTQMIERGQMQSSPWEEARVRIFRRET